MSSQNKILELALSNREQHGFPLPTWRVVVKSPLPGPGGSTVEINGDLPDPWLYAQGRSDIQDVMTPLEFAQRVDMAVGGGIDLQRAKDTDIEVMVQAGYLFALSESFLDRHDATAQMSRWMGIGFDCEILSFLPGEPDATISDILIDSGKVVTPEGLKTTPHGRVLDDPKAVAAGNIHLRADIDQSIAVLERSRFIVRVQGVHDLIHKWEGITLTERGVEVAQRLRQEREEAERIASAPPPNLPKKYVKCRFCGGTYLETTEYFDPDRPVVGKMFQVIPGKEKYGWKGIDPEAKHRYLHCPNCRRCFFDLSTERIRQADLIDPPNVEVAA